MAGINRTRNALWRDPITAKGSDVADSKVVKLPPDRWEMLVRYFDSLGPAKAAELNLQTMTISQPIEVEGILFLPALYRAA